MKECKLPVEEQIRLTRRIDGMERYIKFQEEALARKMAKHPGVRTGNMQRIEIKIARMRSKLEKKRKGYRQLGLEV